MAGYVFNVDPYLSAKAGLSYTPESRLVYSLNLYYGKNELKSVRTIRTKEYSLIGCSVEADSEWMRVGNNRYYMRDKMQRFRQRNWVIVEVATGVVIQNAIWTPDVAEYLQSILWVC